MRTLFSGCYWCFLGGTAAVLYLVAVLLWLVTTPFDRTGRVLHRYTCWWATLYVRCLPGCRLRVDGEEKIAPGTAYVLVANHQSMTDIMALSALRVQFKWVSKKEAFRLPCIGWNMYLNRYVCVDRGNIRNVRATMDECRSWLDRGVSLMMFPEGSRSLDGEMHAFHSGAFKLAIDAGRAIVPIVVDGTFPIYRGFQVEPFPGTITIRVLDPIPVGGQGQEAGVRGQGSEVEGRSAARRAPKLAEEVYERMKVVLAEVRAARVDAARQKSAVS